MLPSDLSSYPPGSSRHPQPDPVSDPQSVCRYFLLNCTHQGLVADKFASLGIDPWRTRLQYAAASYATDVQDARR